MSRPGPRGTLGAGDRLKASHGARIVAVEALECPTLLYNGFGEHNIQGIGDKHVPLIHNVMNTDVVVGVSDRATDALGRAVQHRRWDASTCVSRRACPGETVESLDAVGLSGICNIVAAIKVAKYFGFGEDQAVMTRRDRRCGAVRERDREGRWRSSFRRGSTR